MRSDCEPRKTADTDALLDDLTSCVDVSDAPLHREREQRPQDYVECPPCCDTPLARYRAT